MSKNLSAKQYGCEFLHTSGLGFFMTLRNLERFIISLSGYRPFTTPLR